LGAAAEVVERRGEPTVWAFQIVSAPIYKLGVRAPSTHVTSIYYLFSGDGRSDMATETATTTSEVSTATGDWKAGVAGGLAGSVVFGLLMTYVIPAPLLGVVIPSMYGLAPPAAPFAGWVIHMAHGAVLGVGFAALVGLKPSIGEGTGKSLGAGAAYGLAVWVALAAIVMPIWLSAVGSPANPPLPNVSAMSAVGHLAYGVALGGAYAGLAN
jgi:hypothetical protein